MPQPPCLKLRSISLALPVRWNAARSTRHRTLTGALACSSPSSLAAWPYPGASPVAKATAFAWALKPTEALWARGLLIFLREDGFWRRLHQRLRAVALRCAALPRHMACRCRWRPKSRVQPENARTSSELQRCFGVHEERVSPQRSS